MGRGGGGFQGEDPASQEPPIKFLARGGREGLLTSEGEKSLFSLGGKKKVCLFKPWK